MKKIQHTVVALVAFSALPALAEVGADIVYTSGPDKYHAYEVRADADIPNLPLNVELSNFVARQDHTEVANELAFGINWKVNRWLDLGVKKRRVDTEVFDMNGRNANVGVKLNPLWNSDLETRFTLGYGDLEYDPNARPLVKAALKRIMPEMRQHTLGLSQDITPELNVSISFDEYRYTKDPVQVARAIIRRVKRPNSGVFELIGFPDRSASIATNWMASEKIAFDLSYAQTMTVLDQRQGSLRFGMSYQATPNVLLGCAVQQASSGRLKRPNGEVFVESSKTNYLEVSAGFTY